MQPNTSIECKEYLKLIKKDLDQRKLAFFIGAGVSIATNPQQYPSWATITETLKKGLGECSETDPLKIAQLYAIKFGNLKLKETVKSFFPAKDIPTDIQGSILDLKPHYIISTNWDCLFENFLEEKISYIYDVVACDNELTESKNNCKIIKMHGDFSHNNYVLTEEDYLNYSKNFPLIENYIKSIISTHTVVMMGYSFSDIDLKQIINWFQNHSSVQPPIYMLVKQEDEYKKTYLKRYGITTISIGNEENYLRHFLNELTQLNDYTQNPIHFVYNKIIKYEEYHVVLQKQIHESLGHCDIFYNSKKKGVIHFWDFDSFDDEENTIQKIYKQFYTNLKKNDETTKKIFDILSKANIVGITTSKNEKGNYIYESIDNSCENNESPLINFNYSPKMSKGSTYDFIERTSCLIELGKDFEAYETNKQLIAHCEKTNNYIYLFIDFFNHNLLVRHLRLLSQRTRELIKQEKTYPLEELYIALPPNIQRNCREIYEFLNLQTLHEIYFNISKKIKEKERKVETIGNGDMELSSEYGKYQTELRNLIDFVLNNGICIENYSLYREICQKYVRISILQQYQEQTITLGKIELYACIKYFKSDDLHHLFEEFRKTKQVLKLEETLLNWLVDVALENCVNYFIHDDNSIIYTHFDHYIANILCLLAQNVLSEQQLNNTWNILKKLVEEGNNTLTIFKAINIFITIQWNLHKKSFDGKQVIKLLESLLK